MTHRLFFFILLLLCVLANSNHHMFSSISAWLVQTVGGVQGNLACGGEPLRMVPATALGVSRANTTVETECGTVRLAYQRHGGRQCVRAPGEKEEQKTMMKKDMRRRRK